jgi:catechol 2,3-dioxygenase
MSLPDDLRLGHTHLTVTDLDRSVAFYQDAIGLQVDRLDPPRAVLSAGADPLLVLKENPSARPAGRHAGLYHFALLHPSRLELARAVRRLAVTHTPITGASDHGVSEAIYLDDPDGNGIELYADRPRDEWPEPNLPGAKVGMFVAPLDAQGLMAVAETEPDVPRRADPGLTVGHMHLHVGDLAKGLTFYRDVIGFDEMASLGNQAMFVSAGGYHHHLGFNVWKGHGVGPAPEGTVGLRNWTIVLPDAEAVAEVRSRVDAAGLEANDRHGGFVVLDPWEIPLLVTAADDLSGE